MHTPFFAAVGLHLADASRLMVLTDRTAVFRFRFFQLCIRITVLSFLCRAQPYFSPVIPSYKPRAKPNSPSSYPPDQLQSLLHFKESYFHCPNTICQAPLLTPYLNEYVKVSFRKLINQPRRRRQGAGSLVL